jgi:hypothetical protein
MKAYMQDNQAFQKIVKTKPAERGYEERYSSDKRKKDSKPWKRTDKRKVYE